MVRTLLIALGIAAGVAVSIAGLLVIGRMTAARQLATLLPNLVRLFHALVRDSRVPRSSKVLLGFAIAWFVSPIDLVPEFIPVLGPLDDAAIGTPSRYGSMRPLQLGTAVPQPPSRRRR